MGTIVAIGGITMGPADTVMNRFLLDRSGVDRPRVCLLATASGDDAAYVSTFYRWFPESACRPSHLPLFVPPFLPVEEHLARQDVIYVSGGSTLNMLAIWRLHGIDRMLGDAWRRGALLCGASAGSICWFGQGLVGSLDGGFEPTSAGLGLAPGSHCPHYGGGEVRTAYRAAVGDGTLRAGWGVDDGAALVLADDGATEVVTSVDGATAYRVEASPGGWSEDELPARRLT